MELKALVEDLAVRLINTEKNQYQQIRSLKTQIQAVNNNYEVLKAKPHIAVQNIFLYFLTMGAFLLSFVILFKISPSAQESFSAWANEDSSRVYIMVALTFIIPAIAVILNVIRGKSKHKKRIRKANEWWERVGKQQVVQLNAALESIQNEVCEYLNVNPLYPYFQGIGWDNSRDCDRIYDIVARYKPDSIFDAFSIYNEILDREMEREEDRYRQQQILEAIEENNQYQAELAAQGRRAEFDRSIIELQLHEIKNRH